MRPLALALPFVVLYVPYFAWRWSYYGDFFPNTYYAKSANLWYFSQGGRYLLISGFSSGLWVARPVEAASRKPLEFEAGANVGVKLRAWPADHVAKCLVHYETQDLARLRQIHEACLDTGHELLIELLMQDPPLEEIYAAGVRPDWWKLAPPSGDDGWAAIEASIARHDPHCRGVLLLGMEASVEALEQAFALAAAQPVCKGFAVGRSIFMDAARRWLAGRASDEEVVAEVRDRYLNLISLWNDARRACKESVSSASA